MKNLLLLFVLLLSLVSGCWAQTTGKHDGNQLLEDCGALIRHADSGFKVSDDSYGAHWCLGYIQGFVGGLDVMAMAESKTYEDYQKRKTSYVCFPEGSSYGQDVRVVVKWLNDHPETLHEDANTLTFTALRNAFPCDSSKATKAEKH